MNTDEFVALLAKGAEPVGPNMPVRCLAMALGWGAFITALAMAIGFGVRPDIVDALAMPMFWVKLAFPALVAWTMWYATTRLTRPGARLGHAPSALAVLITAIWVLAIVTLINAAPGERKDLVFGETWIYCLVNIPLLSIPVFAATMWAIKGLAPTRLPLAGAAAGLLAGAIGAAVYALHCPEVAAPFIAIWYVIGMSIPAVFGALIGPHLLRW